MTTIFYILFIVLDSFISHNDII